MEDGIKKIDRIPVTNKELWTAGSYGCHINNKEMISCWCTHDNRNKDEKGKYFQKTIYKTYHATILSTPFNIFGPLEGIVIYREDDHDIYRLRDDTDENGIQLKLNEAKK